ncbi:hypothetical protein SAMN05444003_2210 [Cognatiyoonia sediminum]|uniref:Branched-chain amino acid aminotransferase n=1 Tax=Cognatiyoonia sediminum TaxID=1508389 RepID=A0A1M5QN62_9RHOB|nr:sulfotransferase family protein [Cognatiyoonia sediminum]SHH15321.1 hypothetical protein SAMN05444003_2210 [Cognatiyoonia sediminum]
MRIAMWSGPRNLSTAMMYSFANREDFAAWDEPFYAPYLKATGLDHPLAQEIIASHESDPISVANACLGSIPDEKPHFYMKHMPHHMIDGFPLDWASECVNIHLIRHPARVIASYGRKREQATLSDIGFQQQFDVYEKVGGLIVDSADIRADPRSKLEQICAEIGLEFDPAMLSWEAGPRRFDGVWAKHWYDAVHKSTGFAGAEGPLPDCEDQVELLEQALPIYEKLAKMKV